MADTQPIVKATGPATIRLVKDVSYDPKAPLVGLNTPSTISHDPQDSGVGTPEPEEQRRISQYTEDIQNQDEDENEEYSDAQSEPHNNHQDEVHDEETIDLENQTSANDFAGAHRHHHNGNSSSEAGPSQPRVPSSHSSLQADPETGIAPPPTNNPDEHASINAIAYHRDPETVIAYLVPLPAPIVQGSSVDIPPRYFLYAPPAPHLIKPAHGEGYVRKLNRHWQQNVRRAKTNAHNGKHVSLRGTHSKAVRGVVRAMAKLQHDDVTFLSRIHPKTVAHLILIHPWALSGSQTPEELLSTFRTQMFEGKKRAKRDSVISALVFAPALAIDTMAVLFGGLGAEIDGIWMLVSVTAYRTARVITRKMGPEPKTMEIAQEKLIEDAKRSRMPEPEPEPEESEPGAIRRSVDALRRSMGSVRHRMSYRQRSRSKKRKGEGETSTDTSRPQTHDTSHSQIDEEFRGGELEHHDEEADEAQASTAAATHTSSEAATGTELSGMLDHYVEEEENVGSSAGADGGILTGERPSHETTGSITKNGNKGQNFQLTFYPSGAMDALAIYLEQACHMYNGQAFQSPHTATTEKDVLAVMGWKPEKREHETPELQQDDEQWQTREIEDDLRFVATKAAKSWDKTCRKQAKKSKRAPITSEKKGSKKRVFAGRFKARRPQKGKAKEPTPATSDSEPELSEKKQTRRERINSRVAAVRAKAQRKKTTERSATSGSETAAQEEEREEAAAAAQEGGSKRRSRGRAAGAAAVLCIPCVAVAERVKHRKKKDGTDTAADGEEPVQAESGARRVPLKQRLSDRSDAMKRGLSTRGDALKQRREARKEKKAAAAGEGQTDAATAGDDAVAGEEAERQPTDVVGPVTGADGQPRLEEDLQEENAPKEKKSKKARLLAIPAGLAAAIGAALKKRRDSRSKKTSTTTATSDEGSVATATSDPAQKKPSKFSALKERLRLLRTRVTKNRRGSDAKAYFAELKQKRKTKSESKKTKKAKSTPEAEATVADSEEQPKSTKERGAIAGLVAGCIALPVAKAKAVRDKRRQKKATTPTSGDSVAPPPASSTASSESPTRNIQTPASDRRSYHPPIAEEDEEEDEPSHNTPATTTAAAGNQYLPGHGQSEIPVEPERPATRLGSSETAVENPPAATTDTQQTKAPGLSAAAAVKFKSLRDGIGGFAARKRTTDGAHTEEPVTARTEDATSPSRGRLAGFQGFKDGVGNFRSRRRGSDGAAAAQDESVTPDTAASTEKPPPAIPDDAPAKEGRFKTLKDGLSNITAKKRGTEETTPKEKGPKTYTPAFVERLKWVWYMA